MTSQTDNIPFLLNSADDIAATLENILKDKRVGNDITLNTDRETFNEGFTELSIIRVILDQIEDRIKQNPDLLTDRVLNAYMALATDSPYDNLQTFETTRQEYSLAQEQALFVTQNLSFIAFSLPAKTARCVVASLKKMAMENKDVYLRSGATEGLCRIAMSMKQNQSQPLVIAALQNIGQNNSSAAMRRIARNNLLDLAQITEAITPFAMQAHICGAQDPDPHSRARSLAMLFNRVKSTSCEIEEVRKLQIDFMFAADNNPDTTEAGQTAREALSFATDRLRTGKTGEYYFPYDPRPKA